MLVRCCGFLALVLALGIGWFASLDRSLEYQNLDDRVFIVTGATSGVGKHAADILSKWGARVIIGARNATKAALTVAEIRADPRRGSVEAWDLDLTDLQSVRAFAARAKEELPRVDVLVNNAAAAGNPTKIEATKDGFEAVFQANYLGHAELTLSLLPALARQPGSRVVHVASTAAFVGKLDLEAMTSAKAYEQSEAWQQCQQWCNWIPFGDIITPRCRYPMSKLAQVAFTGKLAREMKRLNADVAHLTLHPISGATGLQDGQPGNGFWQGMGRFFCYSTWGLCSTHTAGLLTVHVATHPHLQKAGGTFFNSDSPPYVCGPDVSKCAVLDVPVATADEDALFAKTCALLGRDCSQLL